MFSQIGGPAEAEAEDELDVSGVPAVYAAVYFGSVIWPVQRLGRPAPGDWHWLEAKDIDDEFDRFSIAKRVGLGVWVGKLGMAIVGASNKTASSHDANCPRKVPSSRMTRVYWGSLVVNLVMCEGKSSKVEARKKVCRGNVDDMERDHGIGFYTQDCDGLILGKCYSCNQSDHSVTFYGIHFNSFIDPALSCESATFYENQNICFEELSILKYHYHTLFRIFYFGY